jgi:hypothetical protein
MSNVGRVLHGYCNGYFGRDSYDDKRIEAEGYDWLVVRDSAGRPDFADFKDSTDKQAHIEEWAQQKDDFDY